MKKVHKLIILFSIIMVLLMLALVGKAQEVRIDPKPFVFASAERAVGHAVKGTTWVVVKDVKYPLYQGSKGGLFYVAQNKKGEYVKRYLPK